MKVLTELAIQNLFSETDLDIDCVQNVLEKTLNGRNLDAADIYFKSSQDESWFLENRIAKEGNFNINRGFGFRVNSGEKTGFSYADNINLKSLKYASGTARSIVRSGRTGAFGELKHQEKTCLYPDHNPLGSLQEAEKVSLLSELDVYARALDSRVQEVNIGLSGSYDTVLIMRSDGVLAADIRPLVNLSVSVIVESKGFREQGRASGGGRFDYQHFFHEDFSQALVRNSISQALTNLEAVPARAGMMPVVLGPGWPAVLLHEAVGHGLEGDFNRKGSSAFSGRIGEKVASSLCNIVDDGTIQGRRGSLSIDDEGVPGQRTVLIENGILKGYMQDQLNGRIMGVPSTGNGRRESYSDLPIPRMTNTYMLPGKSEPDEILASVENGIYVKDISGGQVDITSGKFVFSTSEVYWIQGGKITQPVKGSMLIGSGPDILNHVSMVGNDLQLDPGLGTCGKAGQNVPVGVGQPTLKIDRITVGGT